MNSKPDNRPDPDELLASLMNDEQRSKKGKLKIFFGMCAGVGKTYSMLKAAQTERQKGVDIVIGFIETHQRKETEDLLQGFEIILRNKVEYKSTSLEEMHLDAIVSRNPGLVVVDELAHTNIPGSRHAKRYQDVLELLELGINVYTTLNVQHLESRSETVAQITGIIVRETVPDEIFEIADEVELIDITPEELLVRLSEGKVYTYERSREAIENFFRKGNITALREMALRIVADRVDKQLHDYMQFKRIKGPWKSGLHMLVAMDYKPHSMRLLRWAKNLSYSMGANIQALYVETAHSLSAKERAQLDKNISLAKQLGIKVRINTNDDEVKAIVNYARKENISHIIVGKPRVRNALSMYMLGNFVTRLIRYSGNIDVYILGADNQAKDKFRNKIFKPSFTSKAGHYITVSLLVILTSAFFYTIRNIIGYQSVSFALLFLISLLAIFYGTGPILLAAVLSGLVWDFFFIPPYFTFHIENPLDMMMLLMFFIIALLNGVLTSRVRRQEKKIRMREERTNALYQLTKSLAAISGSVEVTKVATEYISKHFRLESAIFLKNEFNQLQLQADSFIGGSLNENEHSIIDWVFRHSSKAGKFSDTLPSTEYTFYPLVGNAGNMGVIAINLTASFTHGEEQFWDACISQISGKYERELLREAARKSLLISESERLYKTLFNSISHELRIPVTTIMGASETLSSHDYPSEARIKLTNEIYIASLRLNRLIENLLNMSRLESGRISPHPEWCDVHDLAYSVGETLKVEMEPFRFIVIIPPNMPMVSIDSGLMEQVLYNLIINATQHSPHGSVIRLKFYVDNQELVIQIMDRGTGFTMEELNSVFNKFFRGSKAKAGGTGLGLSIVKGFVEAHKGTVVAENRQNGGALFTIRIPVSITELESTD